MDFNIEKYRETACDYISTDNEIIEAYNLFRALSFALLKAEELKPEETNDNNA